MTGSAPCSDASVRIHSVCLGVWGSVIGMSLDAIVGATCIVIVRCCVLIIRVGVMTVRVLVIAPLVVLDQRVTINSVL